MSREMKEFFNSKAEEWDEKNKNNNSTEIVVKLSGINEKSRVLDIACGTGVLFPELLKLKAKEIVAVDISEKMIQRALEKYKDENSIRIICKDLLEFKDGEFDNAIMYNAYPHFINKDNIIKHVYSLLNKKGRFTIAHSAGREAINNCHKNMSPTLYEELLPAEEEIRRFKPYFKIDTVIDTPYLYMISGVRRI